MITFRTSAEIKEDRRVVLTLPAETPLGRADLTVTIASRPAGMDEPDSLRRYFGTIRSGDKRSADASRIDADLASAYEDSHDEDS
jgi:hypothetical protein